MLPFPWGFAPIMLLFLHTGVPDSEDNARIERKIDILFYEFNNRDPDYRYEYDRLQDVYHGRVGLEPISHRDAQVGRITHASKQMARLLTDILSMLLALHYLYVCATAERDQIVDGFRQLIAFDSV